VQLPEQPVGRGLLGLPEALQDAAGGAGRNGHGSRRGRRMSSWLDEPGLELQQVGRMLGLHGPDSELRGRVATG